MAPFTRVTVALFGRSSRFPQTLGRPAPYSNCQSDCSKFYGVFLEAFSSLNENMSSTVFDLSALFLSIRNIATCFALGVLGQTLFSRHAALRLPAKFKPPISGDCYRILEELEFSARVARGRTSELKKSSSCALSVNQ